MSRLQSLLHTDIHRGLALAGAAGSGRTRLLREAAALASARSMRPLTVAPDDTATPQPLHALAVAMGAARLDVPERPAQAAAILARENDRRPLLLCVDEAQRLDYASLAVVRHLLQNSSCRAVLALPEGPGHTDAPGPLAALWHDGLVDRIPLTPLSHGHMTAICNGLLPQPVHYGAAARLAFLADGNLVHLKELVADAAESGALTLRDGLHHLREHDAPAPRVLHLLRPRLHRLPRASRTALEYLCLSGPLPLTAALRLAQEAAWEELERRRLIHTRHTHPTGHTLAPDPLTTHAITPHMPALRRRRLLSTLLALLDGTPATHDALHLQRTTWHAELGTPLGEDELLHAATTAWWSLDWATALRLARHAWHTHHSPRAALHYRALLTQHGTTKDTAAPAGEPAPHDAPPPRQVRGKPTPATDAAHPHLPHQRNRPRATAAPRPTPSAEKLLDNGACRAALAAAQLHLDDPDPARVAAAGPTALRALLLMGRPQDCLALAPRLHQATGKARSNAPASPGTLLIPAYLALARAQTGQPTQAIESLRAYIRDAAAANNPALVSHTGILLAGLLAEYGSLAEAHHIYRTAHLSPAHAHTIRLARAGALETATRLGSPEAVRTAAHGLTPAALRTYASDTTVLSHAAHEAFLGRRQHAATLLAKAAGHAAHHDALGQLARIVHELTRIGHFDTAAQLCGPWTHRLQGTLDRLRTDFARAAAAGCPDATTQSAERFENAGTPLYAAEAWAVTWRLHTHAGHTRHATAAARQGTAARQAHEGNTTHLLDTMTTAEPLSPREREVALLAAAGHSTPEIARRLTLSPRTIDRHLSNTYQKLGITTRKALPQALHSPTTS
ncbi:LuxR C-terminal-related transcriptional regulator [Streptomyces sp. C10-9-1]|uniref:LuxR C-terminal-related transcriptional regulator n=1 Tax=Streptomyces sp. C10-9-1 TaxID=1859285 RepID=UPI00273A733D|nr:LuxR C-terminal-related transcriptional regulator [Streptomyces sp. C10-9-1]